MELLRERGVKELLVLGGGVIPEEDVPTLKALGIAEIFGPGTTTETISNYIRDHITR
jgi:methylmalonyl-CoA mutase C-terminal domain/subunit